MPEALFLSARPVRAATQSEQSRCPCKLFLSARPVRAATWFRRCRMGDRWGFYPRDPCGPRRIHSSSLELIFSVSIRATRAGRDLFPAAMLTPLETVSIRATRAGRDRQRRGRCRYARLFLSARPVRAATSRKGPVQP